MNTISKTPLCTSLQFLMELDSYRKECLTQRIKKWGGLVRLFVHPLYEHWANHENPHKYDLQRLFDIENVFTRLISMSEHKTPPLITMEEKWALNHFDEWLKRVPQQSPPNTPYVVSTHQSSPDPCCEHKYDRKAGWKKLIACLHDLKVRKILISGNTLDVAHQYGSEILKDWTGKSPYVSRCVGITLSYLSKDKAGDFETELSALIQPPDARSIYLKHTPISHNECFEYPYNSFAW